MTSFEESPHNLKLPIKQLVRFKQVHPCYTRRTFRCCMKQLSVISITQSRQFDFEAMNLGSAAATLAHLRSIGCLIGLAWKTLPGSLWLTLLSHKDTKLLDRLLHPFTYLFLVFPLASSICHVIIILFCSISLCLRQRHHILLLKKITTVKKDNDKEKKAAKHEFNIQTKMTDYVAFVMM